MELMPANDRSSLQRAVVGAAVAAALLAAIISTTIDNRALPRIRVETPNGTPILVEVAETPEGRSAGLSNRERLGSVDGLLLKWDSAGRHPIWMADMRFPLDLVWLDANGRVVGLLANVPPCRTTPCPLYEPQEAPASVAVLEIPAGAATTHRPQSGRYCATPATQNDVKADVGAHEVLPVRSPRSADRYAFDNICLYVHYAMVSWTVLFHDAFDSEFVDLSEAVQDELLAQAKLLAQFGPTLGRPRVDTLKGSQHANMKELRFDADDGVWRVAFAFDPNRRAVLLVAGDKSGGSEKRFYRQLVRTADKRFAEHLEHVRKEKKQ